MDNPVLNCMKERRSIRRFTDQPLERKQLDLLLEAAVWAPSGNNRQSWQFTAVLNRQVLDALNARVRQGLLNLPGENPGKERARQEGYSFYYGAPALIIASNEKTHPNALADCSAALQNILLAAHSLGLGACWINQLRWLQEDGELQAYLQSIGLPEGHLVYAAAAVGYSGQEAHAPARRENTVHIIP